MGPAEIAQPLYVCVHLAEFPAQVLLRLRLESSASAVAVLHGEPPQETVCSANRHASKIGVQKGMTLPELDSFPRLTILRRSTAEERAACRVLLGWVQAFTPRVEVLESQNGMFIMVLDMTGSSTLFGDGMGIMEKIHTALKALHFAARIAAGCNFMAAVCLARFAVKKPLLIPCGEEAESLSPLPLMALSPSPAQLQTFALWGLQTVGELAALPEVEVIVRLGQQGKRLLLLARGQHSHHMVPEVEPFSLEEQIELDQTLDLLDSLLFVMGPMLDQLIFRAQGHARALASVCVTLRLERGEAHSRTIKPALPTVERIGLLKLIYLDLQAHPPSSGVLGIFLSADPGDRSKVQAGLFSPQLPEPMLLDVTLARIQALVGDGRVGKAILQDAHSPDRFVMERFTLPQSNSKHDVPNKVTSALRRFRPPLIVAVKQVGRKLDGFYLRGDFYEVSQAFGPWRRSGEWWSQKVWSCEEWDVSATSHRETLLCLLTHDLLRKEWSLAALYD